jgi:hypothetical protein
MQGAAISRLALYDYLRFMSVNFWYQAIALIDPGRQRSDLSTVISDESRLVFRLELLTRFPRFQDQSRPCNRLSSQ